METRTLPYMLQFYGSETNPVNILSGEGIKEVIKDKTLFKDLETKNILIGHLRIEWATGTSWNDKKDSVIEFSRTTKDGELKTRIPVHYFLKLNQFITYAVELDLKTSLPLDGKTEIKCYAANGSTVDMYLWDTTKLLKEDDKTDYDAQFKKFIEQDILCTDFIHIYNPTDEAVQAELRFGENGVTVDGDKLTVETNGITYATGDKVYLHKACCLNTPSQLSVPIIIDGGKYTHYLAKLNQFTTTGCELDAELIVGQNNAELPASVSIFIYAHMHYYLFLTKNKKASKKVNWIYEEPKGYSKQDFDNKDEVIAELSKIEDRKKQLEGIVKEFVQEFEALN